MKIMLTPLCLLLSAAALANPRKTWSSLNRARKNRVRVIAVRNITEFGNQRFVPPV